MSNTAPAGFFTPQANGMDPNNKYPFFPAGFIGEVEVVECKGITRRNGERAFIAALEIVSSNLPDVHVGGRYTWFQSLKEPGTAYPACISFLYAVMGLDPNRDKAKIEKIKPEQDKYLNEAVSDANPLRKRRAVLQTSVKKTKANADFTLHTFSPLAAKAA